MYKIEIGNKTGEKREFECDGTANIYALFRELNITDYPYRLKVGQNKNGVSVRIVSDNDFDAAIAKILTNNRDTLNDSLIVSRLLYGKISCYFSAPLSTEETERLKDAITGQNSDGFGEGFEQRGIKTEDGEIHVSFWNHKEYFLKTKAKMNSARFNR